MGSEMCIRDSSPANQDISNGVKKGASKVEQAVSDKDKARFAPEIYAITLDARPPGEQPTSKIPAAISGGRLEIKTKEIAIKGMIVNWHTKPTAILLGILSTRKKSSTPTEVPMPNMIIINSGTIRPVVL